METFCSCRAALERSLQEIAGFFSGGAIVVRTRQWKNNVRNDSPPVAGVTPPPFFTNLGLIQSHGE